MANGDAALEAGMDILDGNDDRRNGWDEVNKTRDYIAERTSAVTPVAKGGTGGITAAQARANLGAVATEDVQVPGGSVANKIARYDSSGRLIAATPAEANQATPKVYVDSAVASAAAGRFPAAGGTMTGDLGVLGNVILPNLTPVTSGYVAMYRNGDGRVGISPSALRFKKDIKDRLYTSEQLRAIRVVSYRLKAAVYGDGWEDAPVDVGVIAEELVDAGLSEFVVFDKDGEPLSVHYERLSLVAIGALQETLDRLDFIEARLDSLES